MSSLLCSLLIAHYSLDILSSLLITHSLLIAPSLLSIAKC
jgi:hypothetical protein